MFSGNRTKIALILAEFLCSQILGADPVDQRRETGDRLNFVLSAQASECLGQGDANLFTLRYPPYWPDCASHVEMVGHTTFLGRFGGRLAIRILVADDNAHMRAALRFVLEEAGTWEVLVAANGDEALSMIHRESFDLIILDLAMPDIDGLRVTRAIAQKYPSLPILMHTLYYSQLVAVEALKAGARKVIPKSDRATIVNAVQEILHSEAAKPTSAPGGAFVPPDSLEASSSALPSEARSSEQPESPEDCSSDERAPKA